MRAAERKTLLMLCHDFPPVMVGGVVRPLKFAKYLPEWGWDIVVVTSEDAAPPAVDASFLREIPERTDVVRTPPYMPGWLLRRIRRHERAGGGVSSGGGNRRGGVGAAMATALAWARLRLLVPDRQVLWKRRAVRAAAKVFACRRVDAVYTTSPPQSVHLVGWELKKRFGVPWVADFRDHWMDAAFYPWLRDVRRRRREERLERVVVEGADAVLSATAPAREDFVRRYPSLAPKFHLLPNGFDEADFTPWDGVEPDYEAFRIRSFGSVGKGRNPDVLLRALEALRETDVWRDVRVEFFGHFGYDKTPWIRALGERVVFRDGIPHAEVPREMRRAALLLVIQSEGSSAAVAVPGKLYECGRTGVPILGLLDDGPAADLMRAYALGWVCGPRDADAVRWALVEAHARWRSGTRATPDARFVEVFSRSHLSRCLAEILDEAEAV